MVRFLAVAATLAASGLLVAGAHGQGTPGGRLGVDSFIVGPSWDAATGSLLPKDGGRSAGAVAGPTFVFGATLLSEHQLEDPSVESVRFTLPEGLSWTSDSQALGPLHLRFDFPPNGWSFVPTSEGCTIAGQVATCVANGVPGGTQVFAWSLQVTAARPGAYQLRVEITDPDVNVPPRSGYPEAATFRLQVGNQPSYAPPKSRPPTRNASSPATALPLKLTVRGSGTILTDNGKAGTPASRFAVACTHSGGGVGHCTKTYAEGTVVRVLERPAAGWKFDRWIAGFIYPHGHGYIKSCTLYPHQHPVCRVPIKGRGSVVLAQFTKR